MKNVDHVSEELDSWTAHRTETGVVYYYNAITGESTYERPPGFKGEVMIIIISLCRMILMLQSAGMIYQLLKFLFVFLFGV